MIVYFASRPRWELVSLQHNRNKPWKRASFNPSKFLIIGSFPLLSLSSGCAATASDMSIRFRLKYENCNIYGATASMHHLLHSKMSQVEQLRYLLSSFYITHTQSRVECVKSDWAFEKRLDVTVWLIAENKGNLLTHITT